MNRIGWHWRSSHLLFCSVAALLLHCFNPALPAESSAPQSASSRNPTGNALNVLDDDAMTKDEAEEVSLQIQKQKKRPVLSMSVQSSLPGFAAPIEDTSMCSRVDCAQHGACLNCRFPAQCQYGEVIQLNCTTKPKCPRLQTIRKEATCRYCWQTPDHEHECQQLRNCSTNDIRLFRTTCRVAGHVVCKGKRAFFKNVRCNWTNGYSWSKAMLYSVTLGGFGVDRFYLGLWKSAIGKLFSFGGLGIWTIVDIVLIAVDYIQPADGSLYI